MNWTEIAKLIKPRVERVTLLPGLINFIKAGGQEVIINETCFIERINEKLTLDIACFIDETVLAGILNGVNKNYGAPYIMLYNKVRNFNFKNETSRQLIFVNDLDEHSHTCLTSVQFLIRNNKLHMVANFRSWCPETHGYSDLVLLNNMFNLVSNKLQIERALLTVNVASLHIKKLTD